MRTAQTQVAHNGDGQGGIDGAPPEADNGEHPSAGIEGGSFRSLGGSLDYTGWAERERFVELDRALEAEMRENDSDGRRQRHRSNREKKHFE